MIPMQTTADGMIPNALQSAGTATVAMATHLFLTLGLGAVLLLTLAWAIAAMMKHHLRHHAASTTERQQASGGSSHERY